MNATKIYLKLALVFSLVLIFLACGNDSGSNVSESSRSDFTYETFGGLEADKPCDETIVDKVAYVKTEDLNYICSLDSAKAIWNWISGEKEKSQNQGANQEVVFDSVLVDSRNGLTYRVVQIGGQIWMAENLNYETENSYCYENLISKCEAYGRLYTWNAAQNACPEGWHLPTVEEYDSLLSFVNGGLYSAESYGGQKLIASTGWDSQYTHYDAQDSYGFSILRPNTKEEFRSVDFWTSTECDSVAIRESSNYEYDFMKCSIDKAFSYTLDNNLNIFSSLRGKNGTYSVRCLNNKTLSVPDNSPSLESKTGVLTDNRDGHTYKTVNIGNQTWFAENLNFKRDGSSCYNAEVANCNAYGRLYSSWESAMDACPKGWKLPTIKDFETLITTAGGESVAGKKLKSTTGWPYSGNGSNAYGFSAVPSVDGYAVYWVADDTKSNLSYKVVLGYGTDFSVFSMNPDSASVRCIKADDSIIKDTSFNTVYTPKYGTFIDDRNGKKYKTVILGTQIWMAENVNYKTEKSSCYDNDDANCENYGRLYSWSESREVCPNGWHLPSQWDFDIFMGSGGLDQVFVGDTELYFLWLEKSAAFFTLYDYGLTWAFAYNQPETAYVRCIKG